jgi:NAD(P)-dependent dehydrogenase (short-subunit alcohol dehydrogenase family)
MYKTSAIGPVFLIQHLAKANAIGQGSKVILVSSESGSITLRHESEGGGMYGHHGSKAALNMVGKLLSFDLASKGIAVGLVHPGFMRTDMTKSVGFDEVCLSSCCVTYLIKDDAISVLGLRQCGIA